MTNTNGSHGERIRHGRELQAALPEPSARVTRLLSRRKKWSEGGEIVEGVVDLALTGWLWGLILAVPGVIIWILRRLRQRAN